MVRQVCRTTFFLPLRRSLRLCPRDTAHHTVQVLSLNSEQLRVRRGFQPGHPVSLPGDDLLEEVAHVPGIAKIFIPPLVELLQIGFCLLRRSLRELVVTAFDPTSKDLIELLPSIIGKIEILVEPGLSQ